MVNEEFASFYEEFLTIFDTKQLIAKQKLVHSRFFFCNRWKLSENKRFKIVDHVCRDCGVLTFLLGPISKSSTICPIAFLESSKSLLLISWPACKTNNTSDGPRSQFCEIAIKQ